MKLIDAEAAVRTIQALCGGRRDDAHVCDNCRDAIEGIRSLPAAVPVCDVEKACNELYTVANDSMRTAACCGDGLEFDASDARAILSAGYAGSVSKEDVRMIAEYHEWAVAGEPLSEQPCSAERADEIAKRLLAATEGK